MGGGNVADFSLTAEPFLGGYSKDFGGATLDEVLDISLISIAQPLRGRSALTKAIKTGWDCAVPGPGRSAKSKDGKVRLLCLGANSFLAIHSGQVSVGDVAARLGSIGYFTDQSDNWAVLRIAGPLAFAALERICPIDLHPDVFPTGAFARTSMEHLGTIVLREGPDEFLVMATSSSAASFLHALTTSIENVL